MSHVFHRAAEPITAASAQGVWVYDTEGKAYLDAAGGAIVSNVGHGSPRVVAALESAATLDYVHPSVFTTPALELYAAALAPYLPVDDVRIFPTSGGAESVETAIKLARSYHLARGDGDRHIVVSRRQSYHGNTLGALRVSSREPLRDPYRTWLGQGRFAPEVTEYRCPNPGHPEDCAAWHAAELDSVFTAIGSEQVAAFIGEAVGGATLGVAVAPRGYWEAISEVCNRHGVLLIVDEIMTGFGRTGKWFAVDTPRPDIVVSGKGAAGGYWPFGLCMASGRVHDVVVGAGGFTHGYTFSHS
ncbi:MAG: aminotransferase class III-fold pyridoxal phosphate-dependent enzyme, partial [Acidimicrobiia bacterium]|nr:aminotransferase class III-fold pyridoxal phosphate-dependent enzyme [Acidimicrobiia bacterium]